MENNREDKFQLDIPFENISKLQITRLDNEDNVQLMIHVRKPVKVFQAIKLGDQTQLKEVPSPLMFSKPIYEFKDHKHRLATVAPADDMVYLNSWNFKQIIYVRGKIDIAMNLSKLIDKVKATDIIPRVSLKNFKTENEKPQIRVIVPDRNADPETDELSKLLLKYHEKLLAKNDKFNSLLA